MAKQNQRTVTDAENRTLHRLDTVPAGWAHDRVSGFSTDDRDLADTYADMMAKRRELHPGAIAPPSVGELFGLASAYLARSGRMPSFAHVGLSLARSAAAARSIAAEGSPLCLRFSDTDRNRSTPAEGDRLLLVRADTPAALLRFGEDPIVCGARKWETEVGAWGILPSVLSRVSGICYDLRHIADLPAPTPLDRLFVPVPGARLLLVHGPNASEVTALAAKSGVSAVVIAMLTAGEETLFAYSDRDILRVGTPWLRSLPMRAQLSLTVPRDTEAAGPLTRSVVTGAQSPYLGSGPVLRERLTDAGFTVSSAVRTIDHNAFRASMATVLAPLLSVAASGVDYTGIRLGIGLRLPTPQGTGKGDLLALILGIYRAQMEFACPAALFAEVDDSLAAPELTVFAAAEAIGSVPSSFAKSGSGVFCVTPVFTPGGIPDFAVLRQLLREVRGTALAGKLFSARVAVAETLDGCISRTRDTLTCRLSDAGSVQLPVGLILEGTGLPFTRVGTVETAAAPAAGSVSVSLPEKIGKYIWSDRYEITVLSRPGDAAADALAAALRGSGSDCLNLSEGEDGPVSRRILTSRILLLCPGATLPDGDKTRFALRMLTSGGGLILRLGEEAPAVPEFPCTVCPGATLPDGFLQELTALAL